MQVIPGELIKIVHANDHSIFRRGIRNVLDRDPRFSLVGEAENGRQLLEILKDLRPDIIILNLQMPVMDGFQTLPLLKKEYPHIKVLILSMYNDPSIICQLIGLGANGYIHKESKPEEIIAALLALHTGWLVVNDTLLHALNETDKFKKQGLPFYFNEKEISILQLLKSGYTDKEIAERVDLTHRTVLAIIDRLKTVTGAESAAALLKYADKIPTSP